MRALMSVSDKTGLVPFAQGLARLGCELVSTGGTAKALAAAGLPVVGISEVTGFPEMMDGRVKTLHPKVHGGILARRHRPDDLAAMDAHGIRAIDLVVVNLYPFAAAAARADLPFDDLVEEIDIGGPSLVRAAAKNFRDVLVVVEPGDYERVLAALARPGGPELSFRFDLARRAIAHTAAYDTMIAKTLDEVRVDDAAKTFTRGAATAPATPEAAGEALPETWQPQLVKIRDLRYGENPHQAGAWYREGSAGFGGAVVHQGKELSFTNLLDLDAAARLALEFDEPAAVVIKHTNPCGVATAMSSADAYVRAREADALSAFGGIVGLNRPIDAATARALVATFIEAVIAPAIEPGADVREILAKKPNMRVVTAAFDAAPSKLDVRTILGAWLVQERDHVTEACAKWPMYAEPRVVTKRAPTDDEWRALRFAWRVCAHVKSNAVIFTSPDVTLSVGAGQMSRVDAVKAAVMKGGEALKGSVAASDAFFPFRDGLDALAAAGATAVVQPGGSVRDAEVIAAADAHGLAMVFTDRRHFRH
ncbi:MAG TPA: bifunctional phosphoribosylaminoimidazolecarboxamide formyltransferase/IMP cyclohydrolase [Vicinamibacterales bacterium]|nr:bifunctional phosphoribosylaminoimidazolecarboxamide formyltransferase/IMP cyclohydrolase [Vicinamibacterales bacterium]